MRWVTRLLMKVKDNVLGSEDTAKGTGTRVLGLCPSGTSTACAMVAVRAEPQSDRHEQAIKLGRCPKSVKSSGMSTCRAPEANQQEPKCFEWKRIVFSYKKSCPLGCYGARTKESCVYPLES